MQECYVVVDYCAQLERGAKRVVVVKNGEVVLLRNGGLVSGDEMGVVTHRMPSSSKLLSESEDILRGLRVLIVLYT